jgi:hypothetical protein
MEANCSRTKLARHLPALWRCAASVTKTTTLENILHSLDLEADCHCSQASVLRMFYAMLLAGRVYRMMQMGFKSPS